jgi:hypothetical protein
MAIPKVDKYCEDASFLFAKTGIHSAFEALEGGLRTTRQILRPSSSFSATTNVRASSNTASIRM